jgi:hypothetical protein
VVGWLGELARSDVLGVELDARRLAIAARLLGDEPVAAEDAAPLRAARILRPLFDEA